MEYRGHNFSSKQLFKPRPCFTMRLLSAKKLESIKNIIKSEILDEQEVRLRIGLGEYGTQIKVYTIIILNK